MDTSSFVHLVARFFCLCWLHARRAVCPRRALRAASDEIRWNSVFTRRKTMQRLKRECLVRKGFCEAYGAAGGLQNLRCAGAFFFNLSKFSSAAKDRKKEKLQLVS